MLKKLWAVILAVGLLAGCAGNTEDTAQEGQINAGGNTPAAEETAPEESPSSQEQTVVEEQEPVTLTFYTRTVLDDFEKYVNQFVKEEFPYVTLEVIERGEGQQIQDLIVAGQIPDLIWEGLTNIQQIIELDVPQDLTPLAEKHDVDFGQFKPGLMSNIQVYAPQGEVYFLPYNDFVPATHYNKDIFDEFGVAYPEDYMTWEELIAVGHQLTREQDGVQYQGIKPGYLNRVINQMSLAFADPATSTSLLDSDGWRRLFQFYKTSMVVSGQPYPTATTGARTEFLQRRTLAIFPDHLQLQNTDMTEQEENGLRWDIVTYPAFEEVPEVAYTGFADGLVIPHGSKHADLAFQIAVYLTMDPEVQLEKTKWGRVTAVDDPTYFEHAFEYNPAAEGKNLTHIFNYKAPEPGMYTKYDTEGTRIVNRYIVQFMQEQGDVNTLLRMAHEELTQKIAEIDMASD